LPYISSGEHRPSRQIGRECAAEHVECELGLGLESNLIGNARRTPLGILRPGLRHIKLEADRYMVLRRREGQADADLAVGDLPCGAGVLPLDTNRVAALLEKAGVVYDPRPHRGDARHLGDSISGSGASHRLVVPAGVGNEVLDPLMRGVRLVRIGHVPRRDPLHALALGFTEQAARLQGEVGTPAVVAQDIAGLVEVLPKPPFGACIDAEVHHGQKITADPAAQILEAAISEVIEMIQLLRRLGYPAGSTQWC
jgi:hypothetical protein